MVLITIVNRVINQIITGGHHFVGSMVLVYMLAGGILMVNVRIRVQDGPPQ